MKTILNVGGVDYDGGPSGRPAQGIFDLSLTISVEDEWTLEFSVLKCGSDAPFPPNSAVTLTTTEDDGTSPVLRFVGDIQRPEVRPGEAGLMWGYACTDLKHRARHVTLRASDGSGTASFNLTPDDPLALYSLQGRTVGQIITLVLTNTFNAPALAAVGVGAYTSLSPPTLPSLTAADLAALAVVPREPVQLQGIGILNTIEGLLQRWHPQYALWVQPDGTIRVRSIFGFANAAVTLATDSAPGDDVEWPEYSVDLAGCYTAVRFVGLDIAAATLSTVDGTLSNAWTTTQQNAWTIRDFLQPKDASDEGDASAITSTSCTVKSDHATVAWALNFWQTREGWIRLFNPAGTGIDIFEDRLVTACTALSAGGTATISWDATLPLAGTGYTRYKLIGRNGPLALVSRKFHVREPATGNLDLLTFVGSRLYPRFPRGAWVASYSSAIQIFYPRAVVRWSQGGAWPWFEEAVDVQVDPSTGTLTLKEPAVSKFAEMSTLLKGYPADFAHGLPYDVQVTVPYNRGVLTASAPASGWAGTAYTSYGLQRPMVIPVDSYVYAGDTAAMATLAAEHLAVVQDAVVEGSTLFHGIPAAFDPMVPGAALTFHAPGQTTPIDGLALPVRSARTQWPNAGAEINTVSVRFSNLKRPFQADSLYLHPAFGSQMFGAGLDEILVAGSPGEAFAPMPGSNPLADAAGSNALADATSSNPLADTGNPLAGGDNPLGHVANVAPMGSGPGEAGGEEGGDFGGEMDPGPAPMRNPPAPAPRPEMPIGKPIDPGAVPPTPRPPGLAEKRGERTDLPDPQPPPPKPERKLTLREKRGERADLPDDTTSGGG